MTELSITRAWNEAAAFLGREFALVFLIAFLFVALPGAALQYLIPQPETSGLLTPEEAMAAMRPILLFLPVIIILALIGSIAINYLAIRPGASVGEALAVGARRFIMLLLAGLLVGIAALLAFTPLFLLVAPTGTPASPGAVLLLLLVYLVLFVALSIKLLLISPVAAGEHGGPIALIARSWALTRGHFWKLLGFVILFWIVAVVLLVVASIVIALVLALSLGAPLPGTGAFFAFNLVSAVMQAVVSVVFTVTVARIYAQLAGGIDREIFA
jgi:hypothetical protein